MIVARTSMSLGGLSGFLRDRGGVKGRWGGTANVRWGEEMEDDAGALWFSIDWSQL